MKDDDRYDHGQTYTLVDDGIRYDMSWDAMTTLMAHGALRRVTDGNYWFAHEDEMLADPGSVGVNHNKPGAVIAALRAALNIARRSPDAPVSVGEEAVEVAAEAIFSTWAASENSTMTWNEALAAKDRPNLYPKMAKIVPLCRAEARAVLEATRSAQDVLSEWPESDGGTVIPIYASPPAVQPAVTVTEEWRAQATAAIRVAENVMAKPNAQYEKLEAAIAALVPALEAALSSTTRDTAAAAVDAFYCKKCGGSEPCEECAKFAAAGQPDER